MKKGFLAFILWFFIYQFMFFEGPGDGGGAPPPADPPPGDPPPSDPPPADPPTLLGTPKPGDPPPADPPAAFDVQLEKDIYGELSGKIKWPEGMDENLRGEKSLKNYIDKEGTINTSTLLKSFVNAQKQVGQDRVRVPDEHSTEEEKIDFFKKVLGFEPDKEKYEVKANEKSPLKEEFVGAFKDMMHGLKLPHNTAQKVLDFFHTQAETSMKVVSDKSAETIKADLDALKVEWGEAYNRKVGSALTIIEKFGGETLTEYFNKTGLGNDTKLIKIFADIGETVFSEDVLKHRAKIDMGMTPEEASREINTIMGDKEHPYNNRNHPGHKDASAKVLKLFEVKNYTNKSA